MPAGRPSARYVPRGSRWHRSLRPTMNASGSSNWRGSRLAAAAEQSAAARPRAAAGRSARPRGARSGAAAARAPSGAASSGRRTCTRRRSPSPCSSWSGWVSSRNHRLASAPWSVSWSCLQQRGHHVVRRRPGRPQVEPGDADMTSSPGLGAPLVEQRSPSSGQLVHRPPRPSRAPRLPRDAARCIAPVAFGERRHVVGRQVELRASSSMASGRRTRWRGRCRSPAKPAITLSAIGRDVGVDRVRPATQHGQLVARSRAEPRAP